MKIKCWYWGQRARSYRGKKYTPHIVPWWYTFVPNMTMSKDEKAVTWTQNHVIHPMNLTLRSKVNVVSGSWMQATNPLMVSELWFSNVKENRSYGSDTKTWKNLQIWPWGQRSRSNRDHQCSSFKSDRRMCQIRCKPMSNQKIVMDRTQKNVKNPVKTLRSKVNVVLGSW